MILEILLILALYDEISIDYLNHQNLALDQSELLIRRTLNSEPATPTNSIKKRPALRQPAFHSSDPQISQILFLQLRSRRARLTHYAMRYSIDCNWGLEAKWVKIVS